MDLARHYLLVTLHLRGNGTDLTLKSSGHYVAEAVSRYPRPKAPDVQAVSCLRAGRTDAMARSNPGEKKEKPSHSDSDTGNRLTFGQFRHPLSEPPSLYWRDLQSRGVRIDDRFVRKKVVVGQALDGSEWQSDVAGSQQQGGHPTCNGKFVATCLGHCLWPTT